MQPSLGVRVRELPTYYGSSYGLFGSVSSKAEIGVELEIEGANLPRQSELPYHWLVTGDGSLRGPHAEFVLKKPMAFDYFKDRALPYLTKRVVKKKSRVAITGRCSTHIHINVQPLYYYQVFLMGALYYVFEELATAYVHEERLGNLFCVGAAQSTAIGQLLTEAVVSNPGFVTQDKYAAVNFSAVKKYGSLEFRALQGTLDPALINGWIEYLLSIRDYASRQAHTDIPQILNRLSELTPFGFVEQVFSKNTVNKLRRVFSPNQIDDAVYRGIDRVQQFFFEPEWVRLILKDDADDGHDRYLKAIQQNLKDIKSSSAWSSFARAVSGELYELARDGKKLQFADTSTTTGLQQEGFPLVARRLVRDAQAQQYVRIDDIDEIPAWGEVEVAEEDAD